MAAKKKASVVETKRGGIESWDCSECGWFTHGDAAMAAEHIAAKHGKPEEPDGADEAE